MLGNIKQNENFTIKINVKSPTYGEYLIAFSNDISNSAYIASRERIRLTATIQ